MRRSPRRRGLSLLEVLVALAVLLMSLVALTHLVGNSTRMASEASRRSHAALLCRSKMNEFAAGALPMEGVSDSTFEDDPDYHWSAEIAQGAATSLYNITVTVRYRPDEQYPIEVSLSRMVLDPTFTGSTLDVPAQPSESSDDSSSSGSGTDSSGSGSGSGGGQMGSGKGGSQMGGKGGGQMGGKGGGQMGGPGKMGGGMSGGGMSGGALGGAGGGMAGGGQTGGKGK